MTKVRMLGGWQKVFIDAIAPNIPLSELRALAEGLRDSDPGIIRGVQTEPLPLQRNFDADITGCDPILFGFWKTGKIRTVGEADELFAQICFEADTTLGLPAGVRIYLNAWDDGDPDKMREELLDVVSEIIHTREQKTN